MAEMVHSCGCNHAEGDTGLTYIVNGEEVTEEVETYHPNFGGFIKILLGYEIEEGTSESTNSDRVRIISEEVDEEEERPLASMVIREVVSDEPLDYYDLARYELEFIQVTNETEQLELSDYPELCFFDVLYIGEGLLTGQDSYFLAKAINEKIYTVQTSLSPEYTGEERMTHLLAMASSWFIEQTIEDPKPQQVTQACKGIDIP
jgi:hypothetical protein